MLKRLRLLRSQAGLSQKALAEQIGVSQQSINKYENHNIEPDIETLIALADAFGTSVDYLIGHDEDATPAETDNALVLDPAEAALLRKFRRLRPEQKTCIEMVIDNFL